MSRPFSSIIAATSACVLTSLFLSVNAVAAQPALTTFVVTPTTVPSGGRAFAIATLSEAPTVGILVVRVRSTNTLRAFPSPDSIVFGPGTRTAGTTIIARPTIGDADVTIEATFRQTLKSATLSVQAFTLRSIVIADTVVGGRTVPGQIRFAGASPLTMNLGVTSSNSGVAQAQHPIQLAVGDSVVDFRVDVSTVSSTAAAALSTTFQGRTRSDTITVVQPLIKAVTLSKTLARVGETVTGLVELNRPAGLAVKVGISGSGAAAQLQLPTSVSFLHGATTASFSFTVGSNSLGGDGKIAATLERTRREAAITLTR